MSKDYKGGTGCETFYTPFILVKDTKGDQSYKWIRFFDGNQTARFNGVTALKYGIGTTSEDISSSNIVFAMLRHTDSSEKVETTICLEVATGDYCGRTDGSFQPYLRYTGLLRTFREVNWVLTLPNGNADLASSYSQFVNPSSSLSIIF